MSDSNAQGWRATWQNHGLDFLLEGLLLAAFMFALCVVVTVMNYPAWPIRNLIPNDLLRRSLTALIVSLTGLALVTSRPGRRTGAQMNPAVTITFWWMGKSTAPRAVGYMLGQILGAILGVAAAALILPAEIRHPDINYVATVPGPLGAPAAWIVEFLLAGTLMYCILAASSSMRWARLTPYLASLLIWAFIAFLAPLSGMSINPARTLGSAIPAHAWMAWWVYYTAPIAGMMMGALAQKALAGCNHRRSCCRGGQCNSMRCAFTCYRLRFNSPPEPDTSQGK